MLYLGRTLLSTARAEPDSTRAETSFRLSPKRTSPFKSAGESVQSTAGSRGVCISISNAGYTTFRVCVRVLATHSIRQFPLHFPSRASPCATTFRTQYKSPKSWRYFSLILYLVTAFGVKLINITHSYISKYTRETNTDLPVLTSSIFSTCQWMGYQMVVRLVPANWQPRSKNDSEVDRQ